MQVSSSNSSCERVARSGPRRMSSRSDTPRCFPQSSDGNRPRRLTRVTGLTLPRMSFWSGRRVLVTGGGGFLGRSLVEALARREPAKILAPRASELDLRERDDVRAYLAHEKPDLIVHLAAVVGGIGANSAHPVLFFYENAIMGIQLIEEARRAGVGKFVCLGTICAYPKFTPVPFREDDLWNGYPEETNAAYGLAKKMLLVQLQAYRAEYGFPGIYLLPVNLYGPGDHFDLEKSHVIPAMIRKFLEAHESGAREEIAIRDLATLVARETGFGGSIRWDASRPNGQPRRKLDVTRAEELFGWKSRTSLSEGLRRTIAWYLRNRGA